MRDKDSPRASAWCFWKWFDEGEVCVVFIARRSIGALILQCSTWFANVQISHMVFFGKKKCGFTCHQVPKSNTNLRKFCEDIG